MNASSLPARLGYAIVAIPVGEAAGFAVAYWVFPAIEKFVLNWAPAAEDKMSTAFGVGAAVAFTAFLLALTLPWRRRKRRSGRMRRSIIAGVFVLLASLAFAGLGHGIVYDLAFTVWLAYLTAFTYVRYGVLDRARQTGVSTEPSSSDNATGSL
jgi:hypothetical protein